ncbi:MAG: DUF2339 domain-containing protein [Dehalococcoidia bacterium]|nr:DUF2339 domain-containing protein [Dehalococcoidia bacterium]
MLCSNCGYENPIGNRFCTSCGTRIDAQEIDPRPGRSAGSNQSWLVGEVERLRAEIERLATFVDQAGQSGTAEERETPPAPAIVPGVHTGPVVSERQTPPPEPMPAGPETGVFERASPGDDSRIFKSRSSGFGWEPRVGARWLAWVGVLALVLGSAFFLHLAYDSGWIQEGGLVVLGVAFGLVLVGLGEYWHARYPVYAATLAGGGTGIIYLSIFAAHTPFDLASLGVVLLLLFLVTVMLAIQAVRYEQLSLAVMAIGGAYLAPLALTVAGDGPGRDNSDSELIWPVVYLVIVGFGVLYLSTVHNWRWLVGIGLAGSVVGYMRWYLDVDDLIGVGVAQFSLTAIFLLWVSSTVLHHFARRTKPDGFDVAVVVGNAVFFALMSYALMWDEYRGWMGLYALLLGLFYAGVGYSLYRRSEDNAPLAHAMGVMAVVIGTIAVPIQLTGPWVTAVWFAAALAFMAASAARDSSATQTRFAGLGLLALGTAWVVLNDVPEARDLGIDPVFNRYVLSFASGAVTAYGFAGLIRRFPAIAPERGVVTEVEIVSGLVMLGSGFITLGIWTQIPDEWFALAGGVEAVLLGALSFGIGLPEMRRTVYGVLAIAAARALAFDSFVDADGYEVFWNNRTLAFVPVIVAIAAGVYVLRRWSDGVFRWESTWVIPVMAIAVNGLALWYLSAEVIGGVSSAAIDVAEEDEANVISLSLSVLWAGYAGIGLFIGVVRKSKQVRQAALLLLAVPVIKLFVFDTFALDSGYRVAAFMSLGLLLVAGGYLYQRYEEAVKGFLFEDDDERSDAQG